jgi:cephalosporin-C deacetylase
MIADLDRAELWAYRSSYESPPDFDDFWRSTLDSAAAYDLDLQLIPVDTGLQTVDVFDVTYAGFDGHPIKGWLRLPRQRSGRLPAVVQYHGYASGRGHPLDDLLWASAGYAHLLMDTRGQGGGYAGGDTDDPVGSGPSYPGFMTRGITDPETYFYRRVFTDAVRAVQVMRGIDQVDPARARVAGSHWPWRAWCPTSPRSTSRHRSSATSVERPGWPAAGRTRRSSPTLPRDGAR